MTSMSKRTSTHLEEAAAQLQEAAAALLPTLRGDGVSYLKDMLHDVQRSLEGLTSQEGFDALVHARVAGRELDDLARTCEQVRFEDRGGQEGLAFVAAVRRAKEALEDEMARQGPGLMEALLLEHLVLKVASEGLWAGTKEDPRFPALANLAHGLALGDHVLVKGRWRGVSKEVAALVKAGEVAPELFVVPSMLVAHMHPPLQAVVLGDRTTADEVLNEAVLEALVVLVRESPHGELSEQLEVARELS
jgi:hypothetical protein